MNQKIKIDFNNTKVNFWISCGFSRQNNIPHHIFLSQAYDQGLLFDKNKKLLLDFVNYIKKNTYDLKSQLYQDVFASFIVKNNFDKTFLEFGATNGIDLSNTYMLENELSWKGVLAEPDINWIDSLRKNRKNTEIITKCVWSKSGEKLNFFSSNSGEFSTLDDFKYSDNETMPANTTKRIEQGKIIQVETISLNEVIDKKFSSIAPSYISIDTEGSEFEIINSFNFSKYQPVLFTIEHNYTNLQNKIDELMIKNNYERVFTNLTAFDGWYVSSKVLNQFK